MIEHLNKYRARGVFLWVCLQSQVAMSRVFRGGRTIRFVQDITWITHTWMSKECVESGFFRGLARQRVCSVKLVFDVEDALAFY